ncbi:P-loop containing nucleoside triphosphate hydrolase protein [Lentinula raphanica]|nr:P-loop containing nucleoside triphosphate hydrolase protein [Lentinula raphanica]
MPFVALTEVNPIIARQAEFSLCNTFDIPALHDFQIQAGHNVLKGRNTILDVPTGGGKTLAFFYALFYYWTPGTSYQRTKKITLVISPLVGLMEAQAELLNEKGVPAIALSSSTPNLEAALTDFGNNSYRIGFIGPEMARSPLFHKRVVECPAFQTNLIAVNIDEGHCISEWGTDDFRSDYARLSELLAKLPSDVPVLTASATLAPEVIQDIEMKLGLGRKCERISVSNEKPNVAISVRIMQHPQDSFADLIFLFPNQPTPNAEDFDQTLIYVNSRQEAEQIQDFLRRHSPESIPKVAFEFFHRFIDHSDKTKIHEEISSGRLRAVSATDALGMGLDFRKVKRVILWMAPRTFNSLIQKIGRCARVFAELGEAVLFITQSAFKRFAAEFELGCEDQSAPEWEAVGSLGEDGEDGEDDTEEDEQDGLLDPITEPDEGENDEDEEPQNKDASDHTCPTFRRVRRKKFKTYIEARDQWFLAWFVVTEECRRIPWNKFYGNDSKEKLPLAVTPAQARCCDNCEPANFPVETIRLTDPAQLQVPKRLRKSSIELYSAVVIRLQTMREAIVDRVYGSVQGLITGKAILSDEVIHTLAERARAVTTLPLLQQQVRWHFSSRYGEEAVAAINDVVSQFRDPAEEVRLERLREQAFKRLSNIARQDFRAKLTRISDACFAAVERVLRMDDSGKSVKLCKPFLSLPRRNVHPGYYIINERPISMANIRKSVVRGTVYSSVEAYAEDWHCMFTNARRYNEDESQIYRDSVSLEAVFDFTLVNAAREEQLPFEGGLMTV